MSYIRKFTVLARAEASVAFRERDILAMDYDLGGRILHLEMSSRRVGDNREILGDLQVTAYAEADTVEEAAALITRGREMAIVVSTATNCAISPLKPELVYETTPGIVERDYFQRFMPADQISYADRVVPLDAAAAVISALLENPERNRLIRAISQYSEALQLWDFGNELLVLSHLFMGVEAIKKVAWRSLLKTRAITKEELACEWGFRDDGRLKVDEFLDQHARLNLVFQGDNATHQMAKRVSDAFEHGLENGGNLFAPAAKVLILTAKYLREAILKLSGLEQRFVDELCGEKYSSPRGPAGLEQYLRAKLVGPESAQLYQDGYDHPFFQWKIEIQASRTENGAHSYNHTPQLTASIGPQVIFRDISQEIYGRGTFNPSSE